MPFSLFLIPKLHQALCVGFENTKGVALVGWELPLVHTYGATDFMIKDRFLVGRKLNLNK